MDWLREDPYISPNDTSIFRFYPGPSTVLVLTRGSDESLWRAQTWTLVTDDDWSTWLDNEYHGNSSTWCDGVCIIFAERSESRWPDPNIISKLPFSRKTFDRITEVLPIHSSIARVINRNTTAHCSRQFEAWGDGMPGTIAYNCRTTASWSNDLALSATYLFDRRFTYAIMYGCPQDVRTTVVSRLSNCKLGTFHPLTLPTVFADLERNRHVDLVEEYVQKLMQRVQDMEKNRPGSSSSQQHGFPNEKSGSGSVTTTGDTDSTTEWLEINHLRNGLKDWRAQLNTLIENVAELESSQFAEIQPAPAVSWIPCMRRQGTRIRERLLQISNEYDEKIRACSMVIDGLSFATQMEWNWLAKNDTNINLKISHSTMQISRATQRDGKQMRSIALLTMTFLPATFVATVFSMSFFDWRLEKSMVSPYIWIYVVVSLVLTGATIVAWHSCTRTVRKGDIASLV